MADTHSVATLIDSTTTKIQQLQHAFAELESHRAISLNLKWKELEEHFRGLERSLKERFNELEDQEKEYETKASKARELLEKREAVVMVKEQASLERLQEKRDAALLTMREALKMYKEESVDHVKFTSNNYPTDAIVEEKMEVQAAEVKLEVKSDDVNKSPESGNVEVKPRYELIKLCKEMDAKGLHKFISDNRKNLVAIREEVPFALKSVSDPARLVLDSLEDFYHEEMQSLDGKGDPNLLGLRRTCIMLMECADMVLASSGSDSLVVSSNIRERAKEIAKVWKCKLDELDIDASAGNSLEVHAFVQLLATFGIGSEFDKDEICRLIPSVARRRQAVDLCRTLKLQEKMPGVIEILVNSGRQIEAVNMAYAFELTKRFDPVELLKTYLESRKVLQVRAGNASPSYAQNEANERELSALKAVIKCIEEHKLEQQYPVDPLQKRVTQLEKAKADKKRAAEAAKPQPKRPRANGGTCAPRSTNIPDKSFYKSPPYMHERPYFYAPPDNRGTPMVGLTTYNLSPNHGSFYGNGYYQYPVPYLH